MADAILNELIDRISKGTLVPYLGPGALCDVVDQVTGEPIPANSDSLILAMNGGKPMAPKLMYEFPRASMNLELKKGRSFVTRFLNDLYTKESWSQGVIHRWLAGANLPYVIDANRDSTLQKLYADRPHIVILGIARISGTDYRFKIFRWNGMCYEEVSQDSVDGSLPILFKPLGSPLPEANFVASDADFVDYITELMGGFAIPSFVKSFRKGKQYLFIGLRMTRDTERMVLSDIIYDAASPAAYAIIPKPTDKEIRFCKRMKIEIVDLPMESVTAAIQARLNSDAVSMQGQDASNFAAP